MRYLNTCVLSLASITVFTNLVDQVSAAVPIVLENDHYRLEVDAQHGAITRVFDKVGKLELLQEPRLTDNFKFSLPLRESTAWQSTEANYIVGAEQSLSAHEIDGTRLVLTWRGPLTSVLKQSYDVSATMSIKLADNQIRFTFHIANHTRHEIGEVYYPILGGMLGLGDTPEARRKTQLVVPWANEARTANIFQTFTNFSWLGVMGAEQYYSYPDNASMPWLQLDQPDLGRSVYFGAHDPIARFKVMHLDMLPGTAGARAEGNWPRPVELNGLAAGVKMTFVHLVYQPGGQDFEASPVVLNVHEGGWRAGARIYGDWLAGQSRITRSATEWPNQIPVFQQAGAVPFTKLPEWARKGASIGAKALVLGDWKVGGHGDGIPRFEPSEKLGTREELAQAIQQCHELGVKVSLLVNLSTASQQSPWYERELRAFACTDRWGILYTQPVGFHNSPLTGGFGSGERRVWLNAGHPGMRKLLVNQMKDLASLGVDGVHLQDFFGRPLDFNRGLGTTPDRASWDGGLECIREIVTECRKLNPGFSVTSDVMFDRLLEVTRTSTIEGRSDSPFQSAFPQWQPTFTVSNADSMSVIHDALRMNARIRIAPGNGQPLGGEDMKREMEYLERIMKVREILRDTLVNGRPLEATFLKTQPPLIASAFQDVGGTARTALIANPSASIESLELSEFGTPARTLVCWQPGRGARELKLPARLTIPGRQILVVTQQPELVALGRIPPWTAPISNEQIIFDFASPEDLRGWTLTGQAFSVRSIGALCPRATLNSLAAAGESATGTALSPPFQVEPRCDHLEIILHGGTSQRNGDEESLCLALVDASTDKVLQQIVPPSTHELTTRRVAVEPFRGKTLRVRMIDNNTNASFAWIGLRKLSLFERPPDSH